MKKSLLFKAPVLIGLAFFSTVASAAIVAAAMQATIKSPTDVRTGQSEHSGGWRGMDELDNTTFAGIPDFGVNEILTDYAVNCHILHFDPVGAGVPVTRTGRFEFNDEIIGVVLEPGTLDAFDEDCQIGGMVYPDLGDEPSRGLESGGVDDAKVMEGAPGVWNRIEVTGRAVNHTDQVRVITCKSCSNPEMPACDELAQLINWGGTVMP